MNKNNIDIKNNIKKIAMIIANNGFQDYEYGIPRQYFDDAGYEVTVIAGKAGPCIGAFGRQVTADLSLHETNPKDYDMIVFVGGGGAYAEYLKHPDYLRLAREAKAIGAICIAPTLISDAGVLQGRRCTGRDDSYHTQVQYIVNNGGFYEPYDVVKDGNIITANGPHAAHEFGQKIVEMLKEMNTL